MSIKSVREMSAFERLLRVLLEGIFKKNCTRSSSSNSASLTQKEEEEADRTEENECRDSEALDDIGGFCKDISFDCIEYGFSDFMHDASTGVPRLHSISWRPFLV